MIKRPEQAEFIEVSMKPFVDKMGITISNTLTLDKRILIIDDNVTNLYLFQKILSMDQIQSDAVDRAKEAIDLLRKNKYDLVLLDLMMPEFDGFQMLDAMGSMSLSIPVIVISACDTREYKEEAHRKGALDFIVKPVNKEELLLKVKRAIYNPLAFPVFKDEKHKGKKLLESLFRRHKRSTEKKILIIHDGLSEAAVWEYLERNKRYNMIKTPANDRCFEQIYIFKPDLIIFNVLLAEEYCYEVVEKMRHYSEFANTDFVFMAVSNSKNQVENVKKLGAVAYFERPAKPLELESFLKKYFSTKNKNFRIFEA